jgi:DNA mismatch repair protein MutS
MAGLPHVVIERAKEILQNLESQSLDLTSNKDTPEKNAINQKKAAQKMTESVPTQLEIAQMSLFANHMDPKFETLMNKLEAVDPNRITPIEALMIVTELKQVIGN